ncbi:hypothetical protein PV08_00931 [Exophiala spinifera]|uniref:Zn(2)-C6 fungal-type domain-containing protein n=1 Tax=Exophiala spinifera TaxID=91928 RepID=A0A0D1YYJ1_9EURO|nr:uncharacterized protein PV08_00931 [Exophiala spinifera]KIW20356.1 hypothetical protein PV08_00931 [Exophiala spinifera]
MPPVSPKAHHRPHRHACSRCASRKIRCDRDNRNETCTNCVKAHVTCANDVVDNKPSRPRKRAANESVYDQLARYEGLLRKHHIELGRTHTWVPSELEANIRGQTRANAPETPSSVASGTNMQFEASPADRRPSQKIPSGRVLEPADGHHWSSETQIADLERCLWSDLSPELKHPPVQVLRHKEDPLFLPGPTLDSVCSSNAHTDLKDLHPEPRHIFRFWQIFVERVNPLSKIVHVPTLQQRMLDASWDLSGVSKPLNAILFAIYTLAVTSLTSAECQSSFDESRDVLLSRYRHSALRALMAAEFLTSRDFEVLQAFVLFLLANPESELTCTLTAAAIRVGQTMGLNRASTDGKISFFEQELRIRLWWRLIGLDSKTRSVARPPLSELGDIRLPLNVNDADLHPDMVGPPAEHSTPTEMMCVLMKYEVARWLRTSPTATKVFENIFQGHQANGQRSRQLEEEAISELDAMYHAKFLDHCDPRVPLHGLTYAMAKLGIARMRFIVLHPRVRAVVGPDGARSYMTREDGDKLFDAAVAVMEFVDIGVRSNSFSLHLFTHMATTRFQADVYVYVISELRRRGSGDRVELAWKLVQALYDEHPELVTDTENTLFATLGDLTLEAWETRRRHLAGARGCGSNSTPPSFIQRLWQKRRAGAVVEEPVQLTSTLDPPDFDSLAWTGDTDFAWESWTTDFLRL